MRAIKFFHQGSVALEVVPQSPVTLMKNHFKNDWPKTWQRVYLVIFSPLTNGSYCTYDYVILAQHLKVKGNKGFSLKPVFILCIALWNYLLLWFLSKCCCENILKHFVLSLWFSADSHLVLPYYFQSYYSVVDLRVVKEIQSARRFFVLK